MEKVTKVLIGSIAGLFISLSVAVLMIVVASNMSSRSDMICSIYQKAYDTGYKKGEDDAIAIFSALQRIQSAPGIQPPTTKPLEPFGQSLQKIN